MTLFDILKIKYPDANFQYDILIQDDSNGRGPYIKEWSREDPKPTDKQIRQWFQDAEVIASYEQSQKAIANAPIIEELQKIDLASIRPLRAGDGEKLAELEQQAIELRSQLI